jgi:hypothetical protein
MDIPVFIIEVAFMELADKFLELLLDGQVIDNVFINLFFRTQVVGIVNARIVKTFHFLISSLLNTETARVRQNRL